MQELINKFIHDLLAQKNLSGVDPEVVEQLAKDLSERLNSQINRAILDQLSADELKEFEALVKTGADSSNVQAYLSDKVDTAQTAANVMKAFREGYLGT